MVTCSGYDPGQTFTVDPAGAAVTAAWMVGKVGLPHAPTKTVAALAETATQLANARASPDSIALPNLFFMEVPSLTTCWIYKPTVLLVFLAQFFGKFFFYLLPRKRHRE